MPLHANLLALAAAGALALTVLVTLSQAIEYVPEGCRRAVLAGDEYRRTLGPGVHLVTPFVARGFDLDGHPPLQLSTVEVGDGADRYVLETEIDWRITDPGAAFEEVPDPRTAMFDAASDLQDEHLRDLDAETLRRNLADVEAQLERLLAVEAKRWGVAVEGVDLDLLEGGDDAPDESPPPGKRQQ